ncbi:putative transmembrane and TPR repeat-containing protein 1-like [Penaeus vannamei]|uniref:dolichyl-phosphate-mannose--protein mannosyltransferase n=1 Tax=Penaeus vannamei TaxID=6689 RepID=A0A3R7PJ38_PENVA|nr:putative transmembrane and TPR repeat-containing protein 1-like [Penaeus vannamei]
MGSFERLTHWLWNQNALLDHLVNVGLHMGVTVLYAHTLLTALRLSHAQALVSGLAFATHPVHTEAVTGIVGRADLLAALTFLSSFLSYHRSIQPETKNREGLWLWWAGIWACVGVLCKEHALMVLGVCIAWDLVCTSPSIKQRLWDRAGLNTVMPLSRRIARMLLLGLGVVFLRLLLMRTSPVFSDQDNPPSFARSRFTSHNTWLLLCPSSLSYDWQIGAVPLVSSVCDLRNLCSFLLYAGLVLVAKASFRLRQERGAEQSSVLAGVPSWASGGEVGILSAREDPAAAPFGTPPHLVPQDCQKELGLEVEGSAVRVSVGLGLAFPFPALVPPSFLPSLVAVISFPSSLVHPTLPVSPHSPLITLLITTYIFSLLSAVKLWWSYPSAHNNLGTILMQQGKYQEAEWHFSLALQSHPEHFPARGIWRLFG